MKSPNTIIFRKASIMKHEFKICRKIRQIIGRNSPITGNIRIQTQFHTIEKNQKQNEIFKRWMEHNFIKQDPDEILEILFAEKPEGFPTFNTCKQFLFFVVVFIGNCHDMFPIFRI